MTRLTVPLASGDAQVSTAVTIPSSPVAAIAIAHGAGAGMDHPFLTGFSRALNELGIATLRFNFPYVEAGRRMPGPPAQARATWVAAFAELGRRMPGVPLVAAGKSYGGRMASMAAAAGEMNPAALVYLGYPLHPPGDPTKLRADHLPLIAAPQLFVEGTNDPFIQPIDLLESAVASCRDARILWVDGGGHSFEVKGARTSAGEVGAYLAPPVAAWIPRV